VAPARRLILVVAAVAALAACASTDDLDTTALEAEIPAALLAEHADLVTGVSCPDEIPLEADLVVECTADLAGDPVVVEVLQTDDEGSVSLTLDVTPLDVERLADDLSVELTDDLGVPTDVACAGPPLIVPDAGDEVSCVASDETGERGLLVRLLDDQGAYEVEIAT
jgi:hypothetical protein